MITQKKKPLRIALVHEFLVQDGGAEQVLRVLADMFPDAPIYTLVADFSKAAKHFDKKRVRTSFIQKFPFSRTKYQWYLPFMPAAIESFDLSAFDIVISSSSAFAKGVITQQDTIHICYCHSPTRYLWTDSHSYVKDLSVPGLVKRLIPHQLSRLRVWDFAAAQRPDIFIANSKNVQKRIRKYYRRDSQVVYPPVPTQNFFVSDTTEPYFLAGGRLVGYKRFDIIVEAFNHLGIPLKIFGTGPLSDELRSRSKKNIEFLGQISDIALRKLYAQAQAYINPQEEDFGLTMTEALASGCPVIAYEAGGAREIVTEPINGTFFHEQTWEVLADAVVRFRDADFDRGAIQQSAQPFSEIAFKQTINEIILGLRDAYEKRRD